MTAPPTSCAGAAREQEWGGKARATTNGLALDAPSMAGDTGILEAGLTPSADLPLSINLGLQGFVGQPKASPATSRPGWRSEWSSGLRTKPAGSLAPPSVATNPAG